MDLVESAMLNNITEPTIVRTFSSTTVATMKTSTFGDHTMDTTVIIIGFAACIGMATLPCFVVLSVHYCYKNFGKMSCCALFKSYFECMCLRNLCAPLSTDTESEVSEDVSEQDGDDAWDPPAYDVALNMRRLSVDIKGDPPPIYANLFNMEKETVYSSPTHAGITTISQNISMNFVPRGHFITSLVDQAESENNNSTRITIIDDSTDYFDSDISTDRSSNFGWSETDSMRDIALRCSTPTENSDYHSYIDENIQSDLCREVDQIMRSTPDTDAAPVASKNRRLEEGTGEPSLSTLNHNLSTTQPRNMASYEWSEIRTESLTSSCLKRDSYSSYYFDEPLPSYFDALGIEVVHL